MNKHTLLGLNGAFVGRYLTQGSKAAELITSSIRGVKIVEIENLLIGKIRCIDKLIDEVGKGWLMKKYYTSAYRTTLLYTLNKQALNCTMTIALNRLLLHMA